MKPSDPYIVTYRIDWARARLEAGKPFNSTYLMSEFLGSHSVQPCETSGIYGSLTAIGCSMITEIGCFFSANRHSNQGGLIPSPQDDWQQTRTALVGIEKIMVSKTSSAAVPNLIF